MNTPKNNDTRKNRVSSKKKSLFASPNEKKITQLEQKQITNTLSKRNMIELDGIEPLDSNANLDNSLKMMLHPYNIPPKQVISFLGNEVVTNSDKSSFPSKTQSLSRSCAVVSPKIDSSPTNNTPTRSSNRIKMKLKLSESLGSSIENKDYSLARTSQTVTRSYPDELNQLFSNSLSIRNKQEADKDKREKNDLIVEETPVKLVQKRSLDISENNKSMEPERKVLKINNIGISTKAFYSNQIDDSADKILSLSNNTISPYIDLINVGSKLSPKTNRRKMHHTRKEPLLFKHKKTNNSALKQYQNKWKKGSVDEFLKTIKNDKFKHLPSKRLLPHQIEEVHKIIQLNKNPVEMAKPLNLQTNQDDVDFSDLETTDEENNGNVINREESESNHSKQPKEESKNITKRFFKSARSKKQVQITETIKATYSDGKLILNDINKKRPKNHKSKTELFAKEQQNVKNIIDTLDIENSASSSSNAKNKVIGETSSLDDDLNRISNMLENNEKYSDFYSRIPYKTKDPQKIEEQKILIDYLVTNNICNEENFEIFIANPEAHSEKATLILNNLEKETLDTFDYPEYRCRIPYNTNDPEKIEQQHLLLDFLIQNQICTEENFTIFIASPDNYKDKADKIVNSLIMISNNDENLFSNNNTEAAIENMVMDNNVEQIFENNNQDSFEVINTSNNDSIIKESKKYFPIFYPGKCVPLNNKSSRKNKGAGLTIGAIGSNQYQIDAGQKEFGAKQCKQCGLIYSVHEPEEEKIHADYHESLHVLKFRGWIDEDVIYKNDIWGSDGRIVRVTNFCHVKKRQRLMEILEHVVDKELGFSSYILPTEYVAFLAVRRQQIVGLCLVQFLDSANRYICENSVDCCTEEVFEANCGISRIWVSPFHRKMGIASTLITCVQQNTINGQNIDINLIAFSSPTEDGKAFAKKICKRDDFLVYQ